MKKKIFFRFFAVTLISVLLMFTFSIVAVNINTKSLVNKQLQEETEIAATLLNDKGDFALFEKYEGNRELRITIFGLDGNILYESDTTAELENHSGREEFQNALAGKPGTVERYSETFMCNMTYYAVKKTLSDGSEVVLRLAVKSSQVMSYITSLIPLLIVVLAVSLVISFVLSSILSKSISDKITEIGASLKSLNEGQYSPIKTEMSEPELFAVLNEINELNANIHYHIRIADGERMKLNTVLDNVSQSIIALGRYKNIVFANKSAFGLFRGTHRDIGKDIIFLIEDLDIYERIIKHLSEDYAFTCSYGEKDLSVVIKKITDDTISDDIAAIIIITDITNEKLIEKQKSDFFANASHELKTPITVLQGLSELLMNNESIDEGTKKQIARIYKESLRLGSLISDMLTLSKIEIGDAPEKKPTKISLDELACDIIGEFSAETEKRNITTEVIGNAEIMGDSRMIYELLENLISNAVKYNKDGGKVTVSFTQTERGVCLQVKDTGIGIEKEHLPRLCERFYRVDKSHSKRINGTGLGLAIVKHICAICDAELAIESDFGIGTTVTVVFGK